MSEKYFTTRPPCETGLYNWPCFAAGGERITAEVSDLPKVTRGGRRAAGMLNQEICSEYSLQPALLPLCCWLELLELIKERMRGERRKKKNQILVFFHPKESQLFFSRTPCSRFDTLSPKDFLGVFSLFVLRGGKGGVWVAPEPSGTRQNILMPGESNLSCPQARWR